MEKRKIGKLEVSAVGLGYMGITHANTAEGFEKGQELLALLNELSKEKQATSAQISLAWMLCKKPFIIPIPGSRKPERLKENFGATGIFLTVEEIAEIDRKLDTMIIPVFGGH